MTAIPNDAAAWLLSTGKGPPAGAAPLTDEAAAATFRDVLGLASEGPSEPAVADPEATAPEADPIDPVASAIDAEDGEAWPMALSAAKGTPTSASEDIAPPPRTDTKEKLTAAATGDVTEAPVGPGGSETDVPVIPVPMRPDSPGRPVSDGEGAGRVAADGLRGARAGGTDGQVSDQATLAHRSATAQVATAPQVAVAEGAIRPTQTGSPHQPMQGAHVVASARIAEQVPPRTPQAERAVASFQPAAAEAPISAVGTDPGKTAPVPTAATSMTGPGAFAGGPAPRAVPEHALQAGPAGEIAKAEGALLLDDPSVAVENRAHGPERGDNPARTPVPLADLRAEAAKEIRALVERMSAEQGAEKRSGQARQTEIELSPADLGRVKITLQTGERGLSLQIAVERPETLDVVRRHIENLHRDLLSDGLSLDNFDLGAGLPQPSDRDTPPEEAEERRDDFADPDHDALPAPHRPAHAVGRLDIRL
ncbi:MAG: flagellar hook-length control protein FliK [Pseudomonadota bacterium]